MLALSSGLIFFGFAFFYEAEATAACRASLAQSQNEAASALNELIALNPTAESLELKRNTAQAALAAAEASMVPQAIAAAAFALRVIELAQVPVIAKQRLLFARGKLASLRSTTRALQEISGKIPIRLQGKGPQETNVPRFHVLREPADARTPTYRPALDFNQLQRARVRWLLTLEDPASTPESKRELTFETAVDVGCAITLEEKGDGRWAPQLTEDKLLRN